jgi:hypothetical protein
MFTYKARRSNPKITRQGSTGWKEGWNTLAHPSSLKNTELSELLNATYSQYGTISKRQGTQLVGTRMTGADDIINAKTFYNINNNTYTIRVNSLGKVERFNYNTNAWVLLTGTPPVGYTDTDPEFIDDSPVFHTDDLINLVQLGGKIYFAGPNDRLTMFDGTAWTVHTELSDPTTRPTVAKTGAGTGTKTYYYRYAWLNQFGTTLASPANDGGQTTGQGFYDSMPQIDGSTYLTLTLPSAPTGATRVMIFRGEVAENEFFLASIPATQTTYVDKNINQDGQEGVSYLFTVPNANTTVGFHFYLLDAYKGMLVGTTVEFGKDVLLWSGEQAINDEETDNLSWALPDGAGFDGYQRGDGQTINALQSFAFANEDGLAVFKDSRVGLLKSDPVGGFDIQNVNVTHGTVSPLSPHVASNTIRFYSRDGIADFGHAENYGNILKYSVLSLKAEAVTRRVTPSNLPNVCSAYFNNLSLFGISTTDGSTGNNSVLVYDERYNTWSHWTGLHPSVFFKAIHPTTKVEDLFFGVSNASATYGGNVVKMFTGKTDYANSTGSGQKINFSLTTKQYDGGIAEGFKTFDKCVIVFSALQGSGTTAQAIGMSGDGIYSYDRFRVQNDPPRAGFGTDEWGTIEIGTMTVVEASENLLTRYINMRQKDLLWAKLNIQNDGVEDELSILGVYFYFSQSARELPSRSRLRTIA